MRGWVDGCLVGGSMCSHAREGLPLISMFFSRTISKVSAGGIHVNTVTLTEAI